MKYLHHGLLTVCCTLVMLAGGAAIAQTPTTTHLRCFYRLDPTNSLNPDTSWVWGISPVITKKAANNNSFDKEAFLKKFNKAHPGPPGPRPPTGTEYDPKKTDYPRSPYIDLSRHDPAANNKTDDSDMDVIPGYWGSDPHMILANLFYSTNNQSKDDYIAACNLSLELQGIHAPVAMYSAAWDYLSYDYMIWEVDSINPSAIADKNINKIVSFGDSVSDTQNTYNGTYWWVPTPHNYFIGRFSNGKNWLDYLTGYFNLPLYNWAIGGAGSQDVYHGLLPGVKEQVQSFLDYTVRAPAYAKNYDPERTLFTLLIGANDLISYGLDGQQVYENVLIALTNLIVHGHARNIMLVNLPDISRAPIFLSDPRQIPRKALVAQEVGTYNSLLANLVKEISGNPRSLGISIDADKVNIHLFDAYTLVTDFMDNPGDYGITNATNACLRLKEDEAYNYAMRQYPTIGCRVARNKADSYLFWDLLHPTTHTHKLLGRAACKFIKDNFGNLLDPEQKNSRCPLLTEN